MLLSLMQSRVGPTAGGALSPVPEGVLKGSSTLGCRGQDEKERALNSLWHHLFRPHLVGQGAKGGVVDAEVHRYALP